VYSCLITEIDGGHKIDITMSMTAPGCGMGDVLRSDIERKLTGLPTVKEVHVEVVFDPPWSPRLMSEATRLQLGLD
ncbi:MAG: iron-sulfur cluster assembly protein, partial [Silvibacterium sp.]